MSRCVWVVVSQFSIIEHSQPLACIQEVSQSIRCMFKPNSATFNQFSLTLWLGRSGQKMFVVTKVAFIVSTTFLLTKLDKIHNRFLYIRNLAIQMVTINLCHALYIKLQMNNIKTCKMALCNQVNSSDSVSNVYIKYLQAHLVQLTRT